MSILPAALLTAVFLLVPSVSGLPDEPLWSSWLAATILLAGVIAALRPGTTNASPVRRTAALPFGILVGWALMSVAAVLLRQHSFAFLGLMLRGWAILAAQFACFLLARQAAQSGHARLWIVVLGLVGGAAIIAAVGANEYAAHWRAGEPAWRVFATSTPDYLAGYLVMLLPLTLAVFLFLQAGAGVTVLLGLIAALELAVMLTTGSRFALVSLLVGLLTFGGALGFALRRGTVLHPETRRRLIGLAAVFFLAALAAAKPVLGRLLTSHVTDNSAAFRVWTWRGALHMARANPVFGTGIGIWAQTYPHYALTGFTRLAHSGYLQMADECGIVGLVLLFAVFAAAAVAIARGLARPVLESVPAQPSQPVPIKSRARRAVPSPSPKSPPLADILNVDPRLILCGLAGSLAASLAQNIIDSDWSVFFIGVSFWAIAGLAVGLATHSRPSEFAENPPPRRYALVAIGAAGLVAYFACQGVGALIGAAGRTATDPQEAETDYRLASAWDPLNASYPADLGYRVYARQNNLAAAETMLRRAVVRKPDGVNYRRLGTILLAENKPAEAMGAWQRGLSAEPQSLDLLLALARLTPSPSNLSYYRTMARLEESPVGTVRAIGGMTEPKFATADSALGDSLPNDPIKAQVFYRRAAHVLEAYAAEGGSNNPQRQAMQGNQPDPSEDIEMRALYAHVMEKLIPLTFSIEQQALTVQRQKTVAQFDALLPKP